MKMLITDCVDKLVAAQTIGTRQERVDKAIKVMLESNVISQLQADALASLYYEGVKLGE